MMTRLFVKMSEIGRKMLAKMAEIEWKVVVKMSETGDNIVVKMSKWRSVDLCIEELNKKLKNGCPHHEMHCWLLERVR